MHVSGAPAADNVADDPPRAADVTRATRAMATARNLMLAGATAVWVASLKGHGQFGGRLVEIFFGKNLKAMTVARIAIGVLPPALLLLMLARGEFWLLVTFTLLLGASQGVITIVRGAVPLALFGAQGYGAVLGLIATPILLVNAFSPALFALIVDQVGWQNALYALLACAILTWLAIGLMSRWYEGARMGKTQKVSL